MNLRNITAILAGIAIGFFMLRGNAPAQAPPSQSPGKEPVKDYYQRSLEIYEFKKAGSSGAQRGEEIFYYKCWYCHNEYVKGAPQLTDLYKHPQLLSGQPVNDDTVKEKVLNGGPAMPSYRHTLKDADLADLLGYLRDKCCWNSDSPPPNPRYSSVPAPAAVPQSGNKLLGGPQGVVKSSKGTPLEGMMVQLISQKTSIRTTVYSGEDGRYEFPKLEAGQYTLRIARPMEFYPYVKEPVAINGATHLDDIVLERMTTAELLPPFQEVAAQLTGAEWLLSLSGTGEEKKLLTIYCNWCHSYQQIFRNRYDERGWANIVYRMSHGAGSPLIIQNAQGRLSKENDARLVKWLATVRGPESKDPPFAALPRPRGRSLRAIITEYELPRLELATHDVAGDAQGNLWYSAHRSSYIGKLDPRTGAVKEFHLPLTPGALPGAHWIFVDPKGIVWAAENWAQKMARLDPRTGQITKADWRVGDPVNSSMGANFAMDPQGFVWKCRDNAVIQYDPNTGEQVKKFDLKKFKSTYGSAMSADGKYFGGGAWAADGVVVVNTKTGEVFEADTSPDSGPARGNFDPQGNYWSGGRGGILIEFDTTKKRIREFPVPTPYGSLYTAKPDKNGEIWAGELQGGRYLRFNPKNEQWTEYVLPEPYGHDRESWIDNSTNPVTVWYVDHDGWLVRIQPLD